MDTREAIPGVWIERAAAIRDYADAGVATRWIASSLGIPQWLVREVLDQPDAVAEAPTQPDAKAETVCQPTQQQQVTADAVSPADRAAPVIESGTQAEKGGDDHAGGRKSADSATKAPTRNDDLDAPYRLRDGAGVEAATADEAPAPARLTERQQAVYDAIKELQPARQAEVLRRSGVPSGSITYLVEALQDKGLVCVEGEGAAKRVRLAGSSPAPDAASDPVEKMNKAASEKVSENHLLAKTPAKSAPKPKRRFTDKPDLDPENVKGLDPDHPAVTEARTIFPTTVVDPSDSPALLVSGANSRKLGDRVTKGPWAGMPIYQLTLEERATCPRSCPVFQHCYGNGMPLARRHRHGNELVTNLSRELDLLQRKHPRGFVVRLHVLGDFYSVEYVEWWAHWLAHLPGLRIFGYTAWPRDSEIGRQIRATVDHWGFERFAIRFTDAEAKPGGVTTIWQKPEDADLDANTIVCPAQWNAGGKNVCCGSCGICWSPAAQDKAIAFVGHGPKWQGRPPAESAEETVAKNAKAREPWPAETRKPDVTKPLDDSDRVEKFPGAKDRRCSGCRTIFKSYHSHDDLCTDCKGKVKTCPPTGAGHRLPHYQTGKYYDKTKGEWVRRGVQ